jgi:hypothetical protein
MITLSMNKASWSNPLQNPALLSPCHKSKQPAALRFFAARRVMAVTTSNQQSAGKPRVNMGRGI